jgi:hypothetical protein
LDSKKDGLIWERLEVKVGSMDIGIAAGFVRQLSKTNVI